MEPNTHCRYCGMPVYKHKSLLDKPTYCSRPCFQEARKLKRDRALEYVQDNQETESLSQMSKELHMTAEALSYRIARWCADGRLGGHSRTYNPRLKPGETSEYFNWLDFENDVIVGGNLYPDYVVGWNDELPGEEMPRLQKRYTYRD